MQFFVRLLVVAAMTAGGNAAAAQLTALWKTRLGAVQPQADAVYRTAVCGDGSAYFVDGMIEWSW